MVKGKSIILMMEKLFMKVILSMANSKEKENIFLIMVIITQANLKIVYNMEKELNIIQMEILNMKVILSMVKEKEMENV